MKLYEKEAPLKSPTAQVTEILGSINAIVSSVPLTTSDINTIMGTDYTEQLIENAVKYSSDIRQVSLSRNVTDTDGNTQTREMLAFFIGDLTPQQLQEYDDPEYVPAIVKRFERIYKNIGVSKETPAGGTPASSTPASSTPATSTPAGSTPAGSTPAGSTPAGSTPAKETPSGKPAEKKNNTVKILLIVLGIALVIVLIIVLSRPKEDTAQSFESDTHKSESYEDDDSAKTSKTAAVDTDTEKESIDSSAKSFEIRLTPDENGKYCMDKKLVGDMLAQNGIAEDYIFISQDWIDYRYDNLEAYIGCSDICTRLMAGMNEPSMGDPYPVDKEYYTDPKNYVSIIVSAGRGEDGVKTGIVASSIGPAKEEPNGDLTFTFNIKEIDRDEVWGQYTYDYRQNYMETVKENIKNGNVLSTLDVKAKDHYFIYAYYSIANGDRMRLHNEDESFAVNRLVPAGTPDRICLGFSIPSEVYDTAAESSSPKLYIEYIDNYGVTVAEYALLISDEYYHHD